MRVNWRTMAINDLQEIRDYIEAENPRAARAVVLRILDVVDGLTNFPGLGRPGRVPNTRELVVDHTPFIVPYRVRSDQIDILRVYHQAHRWPAHFGSRHE